MKKVLISGYLGFGNFGDEALLYILINDLVQVGFKKEDITVISNNPNLTIKTHNVNSINRWSLFGLFSALLNNSALIFIGGLFQDKTSLRSLFYYTVQAFLANLLQKEVVFFAVGIGPIRRKLSKVLFNISINSARLITVRDQESTNLVPFKENVMVTCDPVWSLKPDYSFQNKIPSVNWQMPILGVSVRNDKYLKRYHLTTIVEKLSRVVESMKEWQILFLPCMLREDLPIIYELLDAVARKSSSPNRVITIENFTEFSIPQQAGILASCEVMIGMRYHALLVPLANEKPVFGIIYDQKVKSLIDFASQVGVSFKDSFDGPWNYFWQNLQHSRDMAKLAKQKADKLHKTNIELLQTLYNLSP